MEKIIDANEILEYGKDGVAEFIFTTNLFDPISCIHSIIDIQNTYQIRIFRITFFYHTSRFHSSVLEIKTLDS